MITTPRNVNPEEQLVCASHGHPVESDGWCYCCYVKYTITETEEYWGDKTEYKRNKMKQNDLEQASTLIGKHMMENIYWPFIKAVIDAMEEGEKIYGHKDYLQRVDKYHYAKDRLNHAIEHLNQVLKFGVLTPLLLDTDNLGHAAADIMIAMELFDLVNKENDTRHP